MSKGLDTIMFTEIKREDDIEAMVNDVEVEMIDLFYNNEKINSGLLSDDD